ncbi:hypothetical protein PHPALM_28397 [Phytophthora palmivora]|uniref:PiggyBac transposable element-derived protein domain-containing protein n=1 Tax=Phytophthora palmivora TaxID=4796 RepID=A0A2P4XA66_9STRA|nr:hypothetical protein PHPALM_28397 [Phytophthora palmivora]
MANLHFTNNADVQAASDRVWKVRSVINTLQETFSRGYATPPVISFDEGIIPSRNRNNPTRQYLKTKPHKWGTKLFLTCCADTAYCMSETNSGKWRQTTTIPCPSMKYYKAIFMGLVDVAIVNAYIVFREGRKRMDLKPASYAEFMLELHAQLLQLKKEDFVELHPPLQKDHEPVECPGWQFVNGVRKRRQRQCKVCSILKRKVGERRATKYYCTACSKSETARLYLCNKAWKHYPGNSLTCFQIWHNKWENGSKRPNPRCGRDIQSRAAGTGGGKERKRHEDTEEKQREDKAQESRENQADDDELSGCGSGDASAEDGNDEYGGV